MKLTSKITIPVFFGLILVIFLVALLSKHFLEKALLQEAFLRQYEAVSKYAPKFLKAEYFSEPFVPSAQGGFKSLSEEVRTPSMVRFTVWSKDGVILFSDLKSVIGFSSANHQELKRLFSEEKPFFIVRERDTNQPVQSEVGEFLDIYIPIRLSREIVGAIQIHSVLAAVLSPVEKQVRYTTYVLIVSAILILAVVYFLANHLRGEIDRNRELYEEMTKLATNLAAANRRLERSLKELSSLYTAITPLAPAESVNQMLDGIIGRLMEVTGADAALFRLGAKEQGGFICAAQRGFSDPYLKAAEVTRPGSAVDRAFSSGEPVISSDISADARLKGKLQLQAGFRSCAFLPLKIGGKVQGIVHLASREVGYFTDEQRDHLMAIARQMEIALENKNLFDELRTSRDELERANKVKGEFLSVMSHELRTPLTAVLGYTGMMQDRMLGEINPEQEGALAMVLKQSRDLLAMINSILVATHLESEAAQVERQEVDLEDFLDELRSTYEVPLDKALKLIWDYPRDFPMVSTDSGKLKHILQNLINNAIKFTDQGDIAISARHLSATGEIAFRVVDTGIGIPKDSQRTIFEMFQQVDSSETRNHGGMGIGLYIVKRFTTLLGGKVELESELGKGSAFTVTFPLSPA